MLCICLWGRQLHIVFHDGGFAAFMSLFLQRISLQFFNVAKAHSLSHALLCAVRNE